MNSVTKRGGKYILTELLEATQSHQVSTKGKLDQVQPSIVTNANNVTDKGKKDPKKGKNNRINKGRSRKKEQLSEEIQMQGPMSLILLDEVRNYTVIFWFIYVVCHSYTAEKFLRYQQADIGMHSHGLRQLVCCKLIVKTCYPQALYKCATCFSRESIKRNTPIPKYMNKTRQAVETVNFGLYTTSNLTIVKNPDKMSIKWIVFEAILNTRNSLFMR